MEAGRRHETPRSEKKELYYPWHSKQHQFWHICTNFPCPKVAWVQCGWAQIDACTCGMCYRRLRGTLGLGNPNFYNEKSNELFALEGDISLSQSGKQPGLLL